ncbi:hypothetical protein [Palleronia aestuarii]|uniref:hypothetical protein n=1 Tax=Palleronia aestuarii TaxID=568105 RepID=UPI000DAC9193|nr:hypothetical protein [Palleronia aestuarii]
MVLSLMLAATPSMAAHMNLSIEGASDLTSVAQQQDDHASGHAHSVDPEQTTSDCQDVCCSGTCLSMTLSDDPSNPLYVPPMVHDATHVVEHLPTYSDGLLRPPRA